MKIEKYEKIGVLKYRLYLDNGEVVDTYDDVILKNELLLKKELTNLEYQKILIETNYQEHYNACSKYISIRIRSTKEVIDYLRKRNVELEDIEVIVERLKNNRLLDDEYFAKCFIHDKLKFTTMGKYRIIGELKKHHIDLKIINSLEELMSDEIMQEKIIKIIEKKINSNRKSDHLKLRNQLYHHLLNQGYPSGLITTQLNLYF